MKGSVIKIHLAQTLSLDEPGQQFTADGRLIREVLVGGNMLGCPPSSATSIAFSLLRQPQAGWDTCCYSACSMSGLLLPLLRGSGSVIECLTRDRRAGGLSLTAITALCP